MGGYKYMFNFRNSIRTYLLFLFSVAILMVMLFSILFNMLFLKSFYYHESKKLFIEAAELIEDVTKKDSLRALEETASYINNIMGISVLLIDNKFMPIIATNFINPAFKVPVEKDLLDIVLKNHDEIKENDFYTTIHEDDDVLSNLVYVRRLPDKTYVILLRPLKLVNDNMALANNFYILAGTISLCFSYLFVINFVRSFTKPIIEMSKITKNMSNLDFGEVIEYNQPNELGILSNSINLLSDKLEENIQNLKDEVEFQKVLSRNMSHELKTPISIIKGYSEGLIYGVASSEEQKQEYLDVIINECNRMDNLVQEILSLSKLNAENYTLRNVEVFSSILVKDEINQIFTPIFRQEKIKFSSNIDIFEIEGNFELIVQAISNFISNAIKYGDRQNIDLLITHNSKYVVFKVFNTGDNIPDSEINAIFETFYKIDKARSRSMNSHGVGLSTVKSVAKLHFGIAYAQNEFNGVEFTLKISNNISEEKKLKSLGL